MLNTSGLTTGMAKTKHNEDVTEERKKEESPVSEVVPAHAESQEVVETDRDTEEQSSVTQWDLP